MSKTREEAYKKGPLLIKIEPCPKTAKAEPCTEECTKECVEKSYTIFDPKPPRKSRKSLETPQPPLVDIIEPPIASVDSSSSSHADSVKTGNSGYVLKSPGISPLGSLERHRVSSIYSRASMPPIIPLVIPEVKDSEDEERTQSIRKSKSLIEENKSSIKESNSTINESEVHSEKSEITFKKSDLTFKNSEIIKNESIESHPSDKYHPSTSRDPSINKTIQAEKHQNMGCVLEVLILERHDKKCKSWRPPDETTDWPKEYNIVSHHVVPICQGHPSPELYLPLPRIPFQCICQKSTNVNKFSSCPVCSRCPCHGRQMKTGYVSTTESEPLPPSEPLSFSDLSEPETFIESGSSKSFRYDYIPDFKSMPIVRQPQQKKYPFFVKCFVKNKKKSEDKADKTAENIVDSRCPQCPEPSCLNFDKLEKTGE